MSGTSNNGRGHRIHDALAHSERLQNKIASGEYVVEEVACFCGEAGGIPLVTHERNGIPHRCVVCPECALIRATPRMTAESLAQFYNNEYRFINFPQNERRFRAFLDRYEDAGPENDAEFYHAISRKKGEKLQKTIEDFDLERPETVVEWGCHTGGMLSSFKDMGAATYGIEIDAKAADFARNRGHNVVGRIQDLISQGVKADLVVMQDVIEHLADLREVSKVGEILKPGGHLYIWTPGFFRYQPTEFFQIAHTYGFCARTLEYVMNQMGFIEVYTDEAIASFWQYAGDKLLHPAPKPKEWVEYITDTLFKPEGLRKLPRFRGVCKFPAKLLSQNIEANLAHKAPDIYELTGKQTGPVVIVGGGPSVDGQIDKIHELAALGYPLIVIARMYPWCAKNGIKPDYVISLDCSQEQEASFTDLQPGVTYLLASVTRPEIFAMLGGEKRYVFDSRENMKIRAARAKNGYQVCTVINGGGSVAITAISVGMNLGFKDFHIFGLDLMISNPAKDHASGIAGQSVTPVLMEVEIKGETILTTPSFCDFAQQTLDLVSAGHEDGLLTSIKFYGDSFLNRVWDCKWAQEEAA